MEADSGGIGADGMQRHIPVRAAFCAAGSSECSGDASRYRFCIGGTASGSYVADEKAKNGGGEKSLATDGHTSHFDGSKDQARDKANTKYLLPEG